MSDGFKQSGRRERQDSVYFDDRHRTLQKKGLSLRVRQIGERRIQTIKASNGHAGPIDRGEWEAVVTASRPDLAAARGTPLERVLAKLRDPLEPLFETRVSRTAFPVQFGNSDITFSLDQGRIDTGKSTAPICELELELKNGSAGDLFQFARQLDEKIPLELSYETKSGRGYSLLDESSADAGKAHEVALQSGMSCAETFRVIAHECLRHIMQNREGIVEGEAEALHQMRIAVRRFRSTMTFFGDIVSGPGADACEGPVSMAARPDRAGARFRRFRQGNAGTLARCISEGPRGRAVLPAGKLGSRPRPTVPFERRFNRRSFASWSFRPRAGSRVAIGEPVPTHSCGRARTRQSNITQPISSQRCGGKSASMENS